ncbi:hypothetical protein AWJ20_1537 [Sugiyamaella lignohabitans]|uniref:Methyltransferase type 11 domain-containing protein n=1 Tax=Sugiyamaella lignohabitans TaxID=796027 RepID=A0A167DSW7_9ASCO|nr:uncharacterized protein AWJ20_1537 [Sugiyamaella lignohabitans]ANB13255.1 hypothetical protein AWJ20_1537 [Sugiyamaella lignohabitans]
MPSFKRSSTKSAGAGSESASGSKQPSSGNLNAVSKKPMASSDNSLPMAFMHPHHYYLPQPIPQPIRKTPPQSLAKTSQESFKEPNYTTNSNPSSRDGSHGRSNSFSNTESLSTSPTNTSCLIGSSSSSKKEHHSPTASISASSSNSSHPKQPVLSHFFSSRKSRIASISRNSSPSLSEDDASSVNSTKEPSSTHRPLMFFGGGGSGNNGSSSQRNRSNSQPQISDPSHLSSYRTLSTEDEDCHLRVPRKTNTSPPMHIAHDSLPSTTDSRYATSPVTTTDMSNGVRSNSVMSTDSSLGYRRNSSVSQDTNPVSFGSLASPPGGAYRKKSDAGLLTPQTTVLGEGIRTGSISAGSTSPAKSSGNTTAPGTPSIAIQPNNTPEALVGNVLENYYTQLATKQKNDNAARAASASSHSSTPTASTLPTPPADAQNQDMSPKSHPLQSSTPSIQFLSLGSSSLAPNVAIGTPIIRSTSENGSEPAPIKVPSTNRTRSTGSASPLSSSLGTATSVAGLGSATYMNKVSDHLNLESSSSTSSLPPRKLSQVSQLSQVSAASSAGSLPGTTSSTPRNTGRSTSSPTSDVASANKMVWEMFVKFVSNSRLSDSLIYAATRKEAWLQYSDTGFRNTHIIELWLMMALRFLFQNQLLFSPKALEAVAESSGKCVLDIQGVFKDHWAWQLAIDHPDAMVYGLKFDPSQTTYSSPPNHEGPANYIPFVGHSLSQLPFDDNFFDVISAKTLWYLLKSDQWDVVIKELYRILKPGGVIELLISDYTLLNRSPIDQNLWDRYQDGVLARNIEPFPSYKCAARLHNAGFQDIHRAMVALPRAWGGQIGQLTDLLSSYYTLSLVKYFSDFQPHEVEAFKYRSKHAIEMHHYEAGSIFLFYGTKPEPQNK